MCIEFEPAMRFASRSGHGPWEAFLALNFMFVPMSPISSYTGEDWLSSGLNSNVGEIAWSLSNPASRGFVRVRQDPERLARLSPIAELATRVQWLRALGPRGTGNPDHVHFVEWIGERLASLGLEVRRDTQTFERWSTNSCGALAIHKLDGSKQTVAVSSAYPYSGRTGPNGVTGPLQHIGCGLKGCANTVGKIAVVKVPNPSIPVSILLDDVAHIPANSVGFPSAFRHPLVSARMFGPNLLAAKEAGAIGVVAVWTELPPTQAADQYLPFEWPYRDIPAIWVAGDAGRQVLDAAREGASATLTLDAVLSPCATSDTLWAVVEGETKNESILVVTHTDGVNAVEENGAIGVLELVHMFITGPRPKRTIVFVFVTGHLRISAVADAHHDQAMTAWLNAHPEWWSGKNGGSFAVAGLVIEHLGALTRPRSDLGEKVEPEIELTYATNAVMQEILKRSCAGRQKGKVLVAQPGLRHLGEGEPLYKQGIPAIALVTGPSYLLAATKADIVDVELMHEQIGAFARALLELDGAPTELLGRATKVGLVRRVLTIVRAIALYFRVRYRWSDDV